MHDKTQAPVAEIDLIQSCPSIRYSFSTTLEPHGEGRRVLKRLVRIRRG